LPDAPRRAASIRDRGNIFRGQGLPRTGLALLQLAEVVERGEDDRRQSVFEQISRTFRSEYGIDLDFLALYDFIDEIIIDSVSNKVVGFPDKLLELKPLLDLMQRGATLMGTISSAFLRAGRLTDEERYYAACLLHVVDVDGQFDEACRILYVLFRASRGENVNYSDVAGLRVDQIRDMMRPISGGRSDILFVGWQEGHLRNCMAHVRLEYNATNDTMHFVDVDMRSGRETYNEIWSYQQFAKFLHMTNGVSFVFLHLVMILGAHDMAFATNPF
jgi:hypothetical protein